MMLAPWPSLFALATAVLLAVAAATAQTRDPRLPPGVDPGGTAVALISTGIDYTDPAILRRLARDGEGDLIGWDFVDGDNRPFDVSRGTTPDHHGGSATDLLRTFPASRTRIVPIRVDPADPRHLAGALAFIARTPARFVVVPMWSRSREPWELFAQAATQLPQLLLITAAGDDDLDLDRTPTWPTAFALDNAISVNLANRTGGRIEVQGNRSASLVQLSVARFPIDHGLFSEQVAADAVATGSPIADTRRAALLVALTLTCGPAEPGTPGRVVKQKALQQATPHAFGGSAAIFRERICWTSGGSRF